MAEETRRMYEQLKRLWVSEEAPEYREQAAAAFDGFCQALVKQGHELAESQQPDKSSEDEVSQSRMLMEMILEVDTAVQMVPPRLKQYRDQLAREGLDRTSETPGENGQKGMAGINLADQAALEFHRAMLGLAINIAQAEVMERMNNKKNDNDTR